MERAKVLNSVKDTGNIPHSITSQFPEHALVIQQSLFIDPTQRPSAGILLEHPLFLNYLFITSPLVQFNATLDNQSEIQSGSVPTLGRRSSIVSQNSHFTQYTQFTAQFNTASNARMLYAPSPRRFSEDGATNTRLARHDTSKSCNDTSAFQYRDFYTPYTMDNTSKSVCSKSVGTLRQTSFDETYTRSSVTLNDGHARTQTQPAQRSTGTSPQHYNHNNNNDNHNDNHTGNKEESKERIKQLEKDVQELMARLEASKIRELQLEKELEYVLGNALDTDGDDPSDKHDAHGHAETLEDFIPGRESETAEYYYSDGSMDEFEHDAEMFIQECIHNTTNTFNNNCNNGTFKSNNNSQDFTGLKHTDSYLIDSMATINYSSLSSLDPFTTSNKNTTSNTNKNKNNNISENIPNKPKNDHQISDKLTLDTLDLEDSFFNFSTPIPIPKRKV
jgi:hypothetical protein